MYAQRCTRTAAVPRAWAWSALTDAHALSSWSPVEVHDVPEGQLLTPGLELGCHLDVLGRPVGATLCVLEAEQERCLSLKVESLAATLFESFTLAAHGVAETEVEYRSDVLSPVPGPALQAWFVAHVEAMQDGLSALLQPAGADAGHGGGGR